MLIVCKNLHNEVVLEQFRKKVIKEVASASRRFLNIKQMLCGGKLHRSQPLHSIALLFASELYQQDDFPIKV